MNKNPITYDQFYKAINSLIKHIKDNQEKTDETITGLKTFQEEFDENVSRLFESLKNDIKNVRKISKNTETKKGDKGDPYIMTMEDKIAIANLIKVPIVEKVIEKTETIKEIPIIGEREIIREIIPQEEISGIEARIVDSFPLFGSQIRNALELLKGEERLDKSAIRGLEEELLRISREGGRTNFGGLIGITQLVAGSGVSIDNTNPQYPTVSFIGGSGLSLLTLSSGNLNQGIFTFSGVPKIIYVDQGRIMQKVSSDGTVNWTGTNPVTLSVWPTSDIIALG